MGCKHWNDYMRAMVAVLRQYEKLKGFEGIDCPYCTIEKLREELGKFLAEPDHQS